MSDDVMKNLPLAIQALCEVRGWSMHWTARGAYLHLEASELIEAIRGKRGDVIDEAADVFIVLVSITQHLGIPFEKVSLRASQKVAEMLDANRELIGRLDD